MLAVEPAPRGRATGMTEKRGRGRGGRRRRGDKGHHAGLSRCRGSMLTQPQHRAAAEPAQRDRTGAAAAAPEEAPRGRRLGPTSSASPTRSKARRVLVRAPAGPGRERRGALKTRCLEDEEKLQVLAAALASRGCAAGKTEKRGRGPGQGKGSGLQAERVTQPGKAEAGPRGRRRCSGAQLPSQCKGIAQVRQRPAPGMCRGAGAEGRR